MLTRIISGLLLGFLFLLFAMQSSPWVLLAFGIPHLVAQLEITSLDRDMPAPLRTVWILAGFAVWAALSMLIILGQLHGGLIALVTAVLLVFSVKSIADYERNQGGDSRFSRTQLLWPSALIAVSFALLPQIALQSGSFPYLLLLIGASWAADTGGVFGGKYFGQAKLLPFLSPGKTIEGAACGVLAAAFVWLATPFIYQDASAPSLLGGTDQAGLSAVVLLAGTGLAIAAMGIMGDLWFSLHKRLAGVKDYGSIIPGHGGVLDRFDAMLFAAPLVYLAFGTA